ncbi:hypothetical protein OS493_008486 [Desmophyllum pertusum]|uniref:Uncharacterized protein n=1 Tax=Desmophyllum pertusum TaxID=174260 RepID=A0A9W9ZUS1_9CNID|nr:hypothetical protein OS493_008486 [Desmophyllum pertusum]
MATKEDQHKRKIGKDDGIHSDIILTRDKSFQISKKCGATLKPRRSIQHTCLHFGKRIDQHRLALISEETEQDLFRGTQCIRGVDSSSESTLWVDIYHEKQMHHYKKIPVADFKLVNLNSDDTRLVNGLLTTTLCSTEL